MSGQEVIAACCCGEPEPGECPASAFAFLCSGTLTATLSISGLTMRICESGASACEDEVAGSVDFNRCFAFAYSGSGNWDQISTAGTTDSDAWPEFHVYAQCDDDWSCVGDGNPRWAIALRFIYDEATNPCGLSLAGSGTADVVVILTAPSIITTSDDAAPLGEWTVQGYGAGWPAGLPGSGCGVALEGDPCSVLADGTYVEPGAVVTLS